MTLFSTIFICQEDGVVAVWDLTEPTFHHETTLIGNNMLVFQSATFNTGWCFFFSCVWCVVLLFNL